jgi:hypothetical protein
VNFIVNFVAHRQFQNGVRRDLSVREKQDNLCILLAISADLSAICRLSEVCLPLDTHVVFADRCLHPKFSFLVFEQFLYELITRRFRVGFAGMQKVGHFRCSMTDRPFLPGFSSQQLSP